MEIICKIDRVDFRDYGVYVSNYAGLLSRPKQKKNTSVDWADYHGSVVDLSKIRYEARNIEFGCFIKAKSQSDFAQKCNKFLSLFDNPNTRRIEVFLDDETTPRPLTYEVYLSDDLDVDKTWKQGGMVGTFKLKLTEPEPVKKVLKYTRTSDANKTVSITFTSAKLLNIYWGDGLHTYDVSGTAITVTHDFTNNGTYYIVVTGNIDEITTLTTTGAILWNKL